MISYICDDVRYLMEYGMGFRTTGNSSWEKKHEIEIHYELNGLIGKGYIHPKEMAKYRAPMKKNVKGGIHGFGAKAGSLGSLFSLGFARDFVRKFIG